MRRVGALRIDTKMVDLIAFWYGPNEVRVSPPMNQHRVIPKAEIDIALGKAMTTCDPAWP